MDKLLHYFIVKQRAVLTAVLLFISFSLSAQGPAITIKGRMTIKEALEMLETQSEYTSAYDQTRVDVKKSVSLNVNAVTIEDALDGIFAGAPVKYKITGNHIFITPEIKPETTVAKPVAVAPRPVEKPTPLPPIVEEVKEDSTAIEEVIIPAYSRPTRGTYEQTKTPVFAIKTNLLWDATSTINLAPEVKVGRKLTLEVPVNYNAWDYSENKKFKHFLVQPELRYWLCEPFAGHFFGVHAHWGIFNVAGIKMLNMEKDRYQGDLYGAGLSYGYHWILGKRWGLEATIGAGFAILDYDQYECGDCGNYIGSDKKTYFGPTKAGISLIYLIK